MPYSITLSESACRAWTAVCAFTRIQERINGAEAEQKVFCCYLSQPQDSQERSLCAQTEKASAPWAVPHQDPHATLFISSTWKMASWVRSAQSLLWLSAAFVPSFSDQQDDNSLWALLPRWHLSWQTCCPWLASHLRCLSLVRRSPWFNDVLAGLRVHLWAFHPLQGWGGWRVHANCSLLCTPLRSCIR